MRYFLSLAAAVMLALVALSACNSQDHTPVASALPPPSAAPQASPAAPGDGARRITVAEARELVDKGQAVVVDTRAQSAYEEGHIKGALSIPWDKILDHLNELPRDKTIITYCT